MNSCSIQTVTTIIYDTLLMIPKVMAQLIAEYVIINFKGKCIKKIGTHGLTQSQFYFPCGIANDGENIYVCDLNNERIQVLNGKGEFMFCFGNKKFRPVNISFYDSYLYVTNYRYDKIDVFHSFDGKHIFSFECVCPWAICVYRSIIYISSMNKIKRYTLNGRLIGEWNLGRSPNDLIAIDDKLYILDNNKISCFSLGGKYKFKFKWSHLILDETIERGAKNITIIDDNIFISKKSRIIQYNKSGTLIKIFNDVDNCEKNFDGITFLNNICFASDHRNGCLYMLNNII